MVSAPNVSLWEKIREAANGPYPGRWLAGTAIAAVVAFFALGNFEKSLRPAAPMVFSGTEGKAAAESPSTLVVHVVGAVRTPGLVKLPSGARTGDAIKAAGGAWTNAALDALNLAAKVEDGQKIIVPKRGTVASVASVPRTSAPVRRVARRDFESSIPVVPPGVMTLEPLPVAAPPGENPRQSEPATPKSTAGQMVTLNSATIADLDSLPGVGPKTAEAIIAYRKEKGGFSSVEELVNVKGIGPKKMEKMRPFLKL